MIILISQSCFTVYQILVERSNYKHFFDLDKDKLKILACTVMGCNVLYCLTFFLPLTVLFWV